MTMILFLATVLAVTGVAAKLTVETTRSTGEDGDGGKAQKRKSPAKKHKKGPVQKLGKSNPTITCFVCHELFKFEAYIYSRSPGNDGYTYSYKQYCQNVQRYHNQHLLDAGFVRYYYRRVPQSNNVNMENEERGYWHGIIVRYPPSGVTTEESRREGLAILRQYFMDPRNTNYPPSRIDMEDITRPPDE